MRLLSSKTLEFEEFFNLDDIPQYAILSHTWQGNEEVSYEEMLKPCSRTKQKSGYQKILNTAKQAQSDGMQYFWVDTCCINKSSSAELTESINSMYKWYQESACCYVYFSDIQLPIISDKEFSHKSSREDWFLQTETSKWYSRGWTLQELLAPGQIWFYDRDWTCLGNKIDHLDPLSEITNIPTSFLNGRSLRQASIAARMSWASRRETTRKEDLAYCLLGIMDVNMSPIYGEGATKAFIRLQELILRANDDHSIFAWRAQRGNGMWAWRGLFAQSPKEFQRSSNIVKINSSLDTNCQISENKIRLSLPIVSTSECEITGPRLRNEFLAVLRCRKQGPEDDIAIVIARVNETDFVRVDCSTLGHISRVSSDDRRDFFTRIAIPRALSNETWHRWVCSRVGALEIASLPFGGELIDCEPHPGWDAYNEAWIFSSANLQEVSCQLSFSDRNSFRFTAVFDRRIQDPTEQLRVEISAGTRCDFDLEVKSKRLVWSNALSRALIKLDVVESASYRNNGRPRTRLYDSGYQSRSRGSRSRSNSLGSIRDRGYASDRDTDNGGDTSDEDRRSYTGRRPRRHRKGIIGRLSNAFR